MLDPLNNARESEVREILGAPVGELIEGTPGRPRRLVCACRAEGAVRPNRELYVDLASPEERPARLCFSTRRVAERAVDERVPGPERRTPLLADRRLLESLGE